METPARGNQSNPHGNSTMVPRFDISNYQSLLTAPAPKVAPKAKAISASTAGGGGGSGPFFNEKIHHFVFNLVVSSLRIRGEVAHLTDTFSHLRGEVANLMYTSSHPSPANPRKSPVLIVASAL